jgi:hypothetical protein
MKKILLFSMLVAGGMVFQSANAQVRVSAQININSQPDWGPSGYDYAQYYYLPEADMYYNVVTREYVYNERGRWVNVRVLPPSLRNFNLYSSYKVVINDRNPWLRNDTYRRQYAGYRNRHDQINWRDSRRVVVKNDRRNDNWGRDNRNGHDDHGHRNSRH